ncbi:6881_t:CDS:2 [Scutellospora calospora]|uniref:6881_t:CDS:1 n=1 Tax=Scutellospora calospora TaxID=85575 RepID=A0ACA9K4I2_9GLOM|nr:6881_t:CDS:2 [Scutellospora calospora]
MQINYIKLWTLAIQELKLESRFDNYIRAVISMENMKEHNHELSEKYLLTYLSEY